MRLGVSSDLGAGSTSEWAKSNKELGLGSAVFPLSSVDSKERIDEYVRAAKEADIMLAEVGMWILLT